MDSGVQIQSNRALCAPLPPAPPPDSAFQPRANAPGFPGRAVGGAARRYLRQWGTKSGRLLCRLRGGRTDDEYMQPAAGAEAEAEAPPRSEPAGPRAGGAAAGIRHQLEQTRQPEL
jgi:hypothetical protein